MSACSVYLSTDLFTDLFPDRLIRDIHPNCKKTVVKKQLKKQLQKTDYKTTMKILMVTPYLGPVYGGIATVVPKIVEALGKQPLEIDLITTNANDTNKLDVPLNTWIEQAGLQGRYRVQYFASWNRNDFIVSAALLRWLWQNVGAYDLLHSHTLFTPLMDMAHLIAQIKRVPYVMTPHGMLEPWALAYKAWKKRLYYRLVEKRSLKKAAAIQALTAVEVGQIQSLGLTKTALVPNGIYCDRFENMPSADLFYQRYPALTGKSLILFLGRIDPKKGLDLLARAFAPIASTYPNAHLVVAGPDSINFLPTAAGYFEAAGCLARVTFTGMLNGDLKFSALAAASVYVAPSRSEGFSMSILEGMASALPCVFTTGCNFTEAAEAGVAYETAIDGEAIAQALLRCFEKPDAAKAMGDRAKQFIFDHYTWERIAERLAGAYANIVNPASSATASSATAAVNAMPVKPAPSTP